MIDRDKLLAFLAEKQKHPNLLYGTAIDVVIVAIKRGDFDTEKEVT